MPGNGKCVTYSRVSTNDGDQNTDNQVHILRDLAQRHNLTITKEYVDHASGGTGDREQFQQMFTDLKLKSGTTVLFFSLDRLTREGALKTLEYLGQFDQWGVQYKSATEGWLDSAGPFKDVIIAMLATLAKQEKIRIGERTRAGLARVKKEGTRSGKAIGRPIVHIDIELAKVMQKSGMPLAEIAREMKVPVTTLKTKLRGRWVKKPEPVWSEPVRGKCEGEEGIFVEDAAGDVVIRYDRNTQKPHCWNHQVELELCRYRHMSTAI